MIISCNREMKKNHYLIRNESKSVKSELLLIAWCFLLHQTHCNWKDSLFSLFYIILLELQKITEIER